ncbi:MAG: HNH endonuclease, partial [Myxococcaceae bacterium]
VRDGDLATIIDQALDLLIAKVKKERFGIGAKPRNQPRAPQSGSRPPTPSRHIPDAVKRAVYERDGGRCTFVSDVGRRCTQTGDLEFDHLDGFARTHAHAVETISLRCRSHNQFAAERMYGRQFMEDARRSIRPGADDYAEGPS